MLSDKKILFLTLILVSCAAIANLIRALWNIPVSFGLFILPGWTGAFFFLTLGFLACWSFRGYFSLGDSPKEFEDQKRE